MSSPYSYKGLEAKKSCISPLRSGKSILPPLLLQKMSGYHHLCRVLYCRSLKNFQIEPDFPLLTAVKPVPLKGFGLQGPDEDILLNMLSQ